MMILSGRKWGGTTNSWLGAVYRGNERDKAKRKYASERGGGAS